MQQLAQRFGIAPPAATAHHFSADLGPFRVKCERHTEFLRLKFIASGMPDGFLTNAVFETVLADWQAPCLAN